MKCARISNEIQVMSYHFSSIKLPLADPDNITIYAMQTDLSSFVSLEMPALVYSNNRLMTFLLNLFGNIQGYSSPSSPWTFAFNSFAICFNFSIATSDGFLVESSPNLGLYQIGNESPFVITIKSYSEF